MLIIIKYPKQAVSLSLDASRDRVDQYKVSDGQQDNHDGWTASYSNHSSTCKNVKQVSKYHQQLQPIQLKVTILVSFQLNIQRCLAILTEVFEMN